MEYRTFVREPIQRLLNYHERENPFYTPGPISCQSSAIDFTSSRIKVELTSSKNQANVKHTSYSCLRPNPVTSTNIRSHVPSTQIPHHLIIPQPSN
ncbi:hypothetical protein O181_122346, partial [Austropuccinia psidii MF-1]|nr:hypothetical protein [Austropuccinia psidii MF-1]